MNKDPVVETEAGMSVIPTQLPNHRDPSHSSDFRGLRLQTLPLKLSNKSNRISSGEQPILIFQLNRSSHQRGSIKKLLLKILQYSQEKPMLESLFNKV